jgi:very-short-patch-repair endonuclease
MDKYGAINISKTDYWKEKVNNSVMERYGTKWVGESKEIQDKIKKTNMERYGVECVFSLEEIRLKSRKTMLEKYGSIMPQCVSSQQNYIHSIYGGELNKQIGKYVADILFTDERIDFEYDGGGHDLSIRLGAISENNFIDKETIRNNYFIKNGYKIFRIISKKDRLPNDSILIEIKNKAFEVLLNTENNIYTYNIDNNTEEYKQINVE